MRREFSGARWQWRGPAPHSLVTVPAEHCAALRGVAGLVSSGWGMMPVRVRVGDTQWRTSLFPKDDRSLMPIKARVQRAEQLAEGDAVSLRLDVRVSLLARMWAKRCLRVPATRR